MALKPVICGDTAVYVPAIREIDSLECKVEQLEECCEEARATLADHTKKLANHETRITKNEGDITSILQNFSNYYTKSETYSQAEVNNLINSIEKVVIRRVTSLPTTGESNVIYLVPKDGADPDVHDEFVWANGKFEKIGDTKVDLSNYVTTPQMNTELAKKQNNLTAGSNIQINGNTISATDTTYTANTGIKLNGSTFQHTNAVTALTTEGLRKVKYDAQGHITGSSAVTKADITGLGIPGSDTNTTYSAGNNITLSGTTFSLTKANVVGALGYTPPTSDTNTWQANTKANNGYVTAGGTNANKVWKTDANGNPAWRDDANTNTTYSAGNGLTLSGTSFSLNRSAVTGSQTNISLPNQGTTINYTSSTLWTAPSAGILIASLQCTFTATTTGTTGDRLMRAEKNGALINASMQQAGSNKQAAASATVLSMTVAIIVAAGDKIGAGLAQRSGATISANAYLQGIFIAN